MKKILLLVLFISLLGYTNAQVAINNDGSAANSASMLDVSSTAKGVLIPRMTKAQRDAITSPVNGLLIYQTNYTSGFYFYNGTAWRVIGSEATSVDDLSDGRTGGESIFLGNGAGSNDDLSNNYNAFVGCLSGSSNTTGENNVAFGYRTMFLNQTGNYNTAVGSNSLFDNTGSNNTGLGGRTLESNGNGNYNTAVGSLVMYLSKNASYNTAVGAYAMREHKRNNHNTAIGYYSMFSDTSGAYNAAVGSYSLKSNINGDNNTALGYSALASSTGAGDNTALGSQALFNATGGKNTAVGSTALFSNTNGNYNSAFGYKSAYNNTTGGYNTSVGDSSLFSNTTGYLNVAVGHGAMFANTTTWHSVAVGTAAMKNTNGGADNTAIGDSALYANVSGSYNTALGNSALQGNIGSRNTAVGNNALRENSGTVNTALGHEALKINTTGYFNSAIGGYALSDVTEGNNNTAVGYNAGKGITTGDNNTIIGANITGLNADLSNNIIIADGSGNQRIRVLSDGKVGLGTSTPDTKLNVYSAAAAEPIAHFQSDGDVSVMINGQGGESYVEIQNDDTGTSNSWKLGVNDNTKLSIQYGSEGTMNSDTEGLKISTDGYVYKPQLPHFHVSTITTLVVSSGGYGTIKVDFNREEFDNGNNFDLSTDIFTAPVHGIYTFTWVINHHENQNMGGSVGYFMPGFIMTSDYDNTYDPLQCRYEDTSKRNSYCQSTTIELNSGEQLYIKSTAFDDFEITSAELSGYLVTALE